MCFPEQGFLSPQSIPPSIQTPNPAWSRAQREGPWSLAVLGRAGEGRLQPLRLSWDQPVPCSECQRVVRRCWGQAGAGETWKDCSRGCQEGQRALESPVPHCLLSVSVEDASRGQQSALGVTAHPEVLLLCLGHWFPSRGILIAASLLLASSCSSGTVPGCSEVRGQGHEHTWYLGALRCLGTIDGSRCARDGPFCLSGCFWV